MSQLDIIRRKNLIEAPETVTTDWASPSASLDDRADEFSLSFNYENGSSVNMRVWIQLSNDNENFGDITDNSNSQPTYIDITDPQGTVIFDINGSGAQYVRFRIEVTGGSIDIVNCVYLAKQFH
jgi:hypothetical protein